MRRLHRDKSGQNKRDQLRRVALFHPTDARFGNRRIADEPDKVSIFHNGTSNSATSGLRVMREEQNCLLPLTVPHRLLDEAPHRDHAEEALIEMPSKPSDIPSIRKMLDQLEQFAPLKSALPALKPLLSLAGVDGQALGENFQSLEDIRQKASTLAKTLERLIGRAYRPPNSAHTLSRPIRCSHAAYCSTSGLA